MRCCCRREWRWRCWGLGRVDRILAFIHLSAVVFLALTVATLFPVCCAGAALVGFRLLPLAFLAGSGALGVMLLMHQSLAVSCWERRLVLAGLPVRWAASTRKCTRKCRSIGRSARDSGFLNSFSNGGF